MIEIIITSSVLILALILARKLCWGKISRRLQYGLWLLVVLRLLVPAQFFTSSLSIMNAFDYARETIYPQWQTVHNANNQTDAVKTGQTTDFSLNTDNLSGEIGDKTDGHSTKDFSAIVLDGAQSNTSAQDNAQMTTETNRSEKHNSNKGKLEYIETILLGIYIIGVLCIAGCLILCNLRFRRHLAAHRQQIGQEGRLKIYLTDELESPCLCGLFAPAIYMIPDGMNSEERKNHILLHEMTHYRHLDHVWTILRSLCLTLYWFHPLVWVAAILSTEDSELACDEGTLALLGEEHRQSYGRTLIEMTASKQKTSQLLYCATGMINGKKEIQKRILAIAAYKKQMLGIAALVVVFALLLSACTAGKTEQEPTNDHTVQEEPNSTDDKNDQNDTQNQDAESKTDSSGQNDAPIQTSPSDSEANPPALKLADDIILNKDGSFRLAEYGVDLTGDNIKDRILFDALYFTQLSEEGAAITEKNLRDKLWDASTEISVRIVEGSLQKNEKNENAFIEEDILKEYSFSSAHAGNGNLALISHENQMCVMLYGNLMYQGFGGFWYEIWQLMPSGQEPVLRDEMHVSYFAPGNGENEPAVIDQVVQLAGKLDSLLSRSIILVNASTDAEICYLYGDEHGLLNGVRRQNAFEVFMNEVGGSGLELTVADFFYPEGREPITQLPENAEAQILAGEILCMEVSRLNNTAGKLDLDGDGVKEVLYLDGVGNHYNDDGWNDSWSSHAYIDIGYRIRVNDQYYESYCDILDPVLMAYSPDGKNILLAVYDDGPSNDPLTTFFGYNETGLHLAGSIPGDLRKVTIDEDNLIHCSFRGDMLQTEWAMGYYYWNGSEIVKREDDIYYYLIDQQFRKEVPLMLLREITVFAERSEDSKPITMKPQQVNNIASDMSEWILLEAQDGTRGWIRLVQYCFPSEESDPFELFEGLNMAD